MGRIDSSVRIAGVAMHRRSIPRVSVLDWEFVYAGSPLADIGNFLRHSGAFERDFIAGYQAAGGTLPEHWRAASRLLDLLSLCDFLNAEEERPQTFALALSAIDRILQRPV